MIPTAEREEISLTSMGDEITPQTVIAKNTMWAVSNSGRGLVIKEFEGESFRIPATPIHQFVLTNAKLPDGSFDPSLIWLWTRERDKTLKLYEIEPFSSQNPVVIRQLPFLAEIDYIDFSVIEGLWSGIKGMIFTKGDLYVMSMLDPLNKMIAQQIDWNPANLDLVGTLAQGSNVVYSMSLNVASPPNEQYEEYEFFPPESLTLEEDTPFSNIIDLSWPAATGATSYVIEVDDNPGFISPTILYEGNDLSTFDIITYMGIHYYRIAARNEAGLQSAWLYNDVETFDNHAVLGGIEVQTIEEYNGITSEPIIGVMTSVSPIRIMKLKGGNSDYKLPIHIKSFIERKVTIEWGKEEY